MFFMDIPSFLFIIWLLFEYKAVYVSASGKGSVSDLLFIAFHNLTKVCGALSNQSLLHVHFFMY